MAIRPARSTVSVALSLALAAFASSCGSGEEKPAASMPAATPTPAPAPRQGAPQAAAVPEAAPPDEAPPAEARPTSDYPVDFPSDVPRYPGGKVTVVSDYRDGGVMVSIDAPGTVEVVAKFFGDGLKASGWQTVVFQVMPDGTTISADKDERQANVVVQEGGQGVLVDYIEVRPQ